MVRNHAKIPTIILAYTSSINPNPYIVILLISFTCKFLYTRYIRLILPTLSPNLFSKPLLCKNWQFRSNWIPKSDRHPGHVGWGYQSYIPGTWIEFNEYILKANRLFCFHISIFAYCKKVQCNLFL